jgi:hypothetical protein
VLALINITPRQHLVRVGYIAQLGERKTEDLKVTRSIRVWSTSLFCNLNKKGKFFYFTHSFDLNTLYLLYLYMTSSDLLSIN